MVAEYYIHEPRVSLSYSVLATYIIKPNSKGKMVPVHEPMQIQGASWCSHQPFIKSHNARVGDPHTCGANLIVRGYPCRMEDRDLQ